MLLVLFFVLFAFKGGRLTSVECFLMSPKGNYVFDFSAASLRKRPAKLACAWRRVSVLPRL